MILGFMQFMGILGVIGLVLPNDLCLLTNCVIPKLVYP
jgi:hypothetical protein